MLLTFYIIKYILEYMRYGAGMGKTPPMGNPCPRPRFNLCGDGDGFGGGDGDGKAISGPAPPRCHP